MEYKRTAVTTKEIVEYLSLRISRIREAEFDEKKRSRREKLILLKRKSELDRMLGIISKDGIKQEIKKMKHNKYSKFKKEKEKQNGTT